MRWMACRPGDLPDPAAGASGAQGHDRCRRCGYSYTRADRYSDGESPGEPQDSPETLEIGGSPTLPMLHLAMRHSAHPGSRRQGFVHVALALARPRPRPMDLDILGSPEPGRMGRAILEPVPVSSDAEVGRAIREPVPATADAETGRAIREPDPVPADVKFSGKHHAMAAPWGMSGKVGARPKAPRRLLGSRVSRARHRWNDIPRTGEA